MFDQNMSVTTLRSFGVCIYFVNKFGKRLSSSWTKLKIQKEKKNKTPTIKNWNKFIFAGKNSTNGRGMYFTLSVSLEKKNRIRKAVSSWSCSFFYKNLSQSKINIFIEFSQCNSSSGSSVRVAEASYRHHHSRGNGSKWNPTQFIFVPGGVRQIKVFC